VLAGHLVGDGFVRYHKRRDVKGVEVPVEEYWNLAVNAVTFEPGKVVMNAGRRRRSGRSSARASR